MVPYELDAVIPELLTEEDKKLLNAYQAKVRDTISPFLTAEEAEWLKEATRAI